MPPLAGGICGGGGGATTPPSPVTSGLSSPLCSAALLAARQPVAGVLAAETAWRPFLVGKGVPGCGTPCCRTAPRRHGAASLVEALWASGHWVLKGGVPTLRLPPAATSAVAPPHSAQHDAAWQAATAVRVAAEAALSARLAVGSTADGHTSPCLSATALGMRDPLEKVAIPSSTARRCATPACSAKRSSQDMRKSRRKLLSDTCSRPDANDNRVRGPTVYSLDCKTVAAATCGTLASATAAAEKAAFRLLASPARLTSPSHRACRPTAPPRRTSTHEQQEGMVGGVCAR